MKMIKQKLIDAFFIILGSIIFAFGVNYFIIANNLAEGGFTGIALIFHYVFGWPVGIFFLVSNLPLFLISWRLWSWEALLKTILGVVASSVALSLTANFQLPVEDLLLAALYGGVFTGVGIGLVLRYGGTTGGADIIGRVLNHYFGISLGRFYLIFDFFVLLTVAYIFGLEITLYSLVTIYVFSNVVDFILDGIDSARSVMIVSPHSSQIAKAIDKELERGTTFLEGRGGFTGEKKDILFCVVSKWQVFKVKKIVKNIDPRAFVIVSDVFETLGEGFKEKF